MAQVKCVKFEQTQTSYVKPCEQKAKPQVVQPVNTYQKGSTDKVAKTNTADKNEHHSLGDKVKDAVHSVINKIHPHEHSPKKVHKKKNKNKTKDGNKDSSSDSSSSSDSESDNETHKKTVTKKAVTVKKEAVNGTCQKKI